MCPNGVLVARSIGSAPERIGTNVIQDLSGRVRALMDDRFQPPAFFHAQPDDVLPDPDLWHDSIRGDVDDVAREPQVLVDFNDASRYRSRVTFRDQPGIPERDRPAPAAPDFT
jgi:hypothetical protein